MRKTERKNKTASIAIILMAIVILILVITIIAVVNGKNTKTKTSNPTVEQDESTDKWSEGTISYNGKKYKYNHNIKTFLFMGVDSDQKVAPTKGGINGGQSDAMFLLIQDSKAKTMSVIALHRNAITLLDIYDDEGKYLGQQEGQICLQHGYGNGMEISCSRSVKAVSRLFYNIPISGYIALNMGGIPAINDAVNGVQIDVLQDLEDQSRNVTLKKGEQVTLSGDEAYVYLRRRDIEQFDSATQRLERQKQYILKFFEQAKNKAKASPQVAGALYEAMDAYMVTNMSVLDILTEVSSYSFSEDRIYTVAGKTVMGGEFEEYHVDDKALYQMIIDVFYQEVEEK